MNNILNSHLNQKEALLISLLIFKNMIQIQHLGTNAIAKNGVKLQLFTVMVIQMY